MRYGICVFAMALTTSFLVPPAFAQRPANATSSSTKTEKDVIYAEVSGQKLSLDLLLPQQVKNAPLLVWIHGGGWRKGNKDGCPLRWLADEGYAVASINYRLTDVACFPAQIFDCKAAIRWLRANATKYGYNAERIGVGGGSAGGHLVALLGTSGGMKELEGDVGGNLDQSSRVQAVVDLFGPSDFTLTPPEKMKAAAQPGSTLYALFGGDPAEKPELIKLASPALHVTSDDPPLLILQGTKDPTVDPQQSVHLDAVYRKAGLDSKLVLIEGAGHGGKEFYDETRRKLIKEFFDKHLQQK
jgi:acetyl esterase/lipase